jgi:hypothetical protein
MRRGKKRRVGREGSEEKGGKRRGRKGRGRKRRRERIGKISHPNLFKVKVMTSSAFAAFNANHTNLTAWLKLKLDLKKIFNN